MESSELYEQILGIEPPWFVQTVELDAATTTVDVYLEHASGPGVFHCPQCQQPAPIYDHLEARVWRHLDTCQYQTYLRASVPRLACARCGILTAAVSWARPHSRFSLLFESYALDVLFTTQVQSRAAQLLRLSPAQMRYLQAGAVARGLERRSAERVIAHVTLDEKSLCAGQHYVSVLCDGQQGAVLEVVEHRTQEAATQLLEQGLSERQRAAVQVVTADMWKPYANAAHMHLPQADLVHDRFHLSGYLNEVVDQTRRAENKRLVAAGDDQLKGTRYLWLRAPGTLTEKQQAQLEELCAQPLATAAVWACKEDFRGFFACRTEAEANTYFEQWKEQALELGNARLTKVVQMFEQHWAGLVAWVHHRVTNAMAESLNERIQQLKAKARGFRTAAAFRCAILFHLGQLDMYP